MTLGEQVVMNNNEAIAEAAVRAGCRFFCGYPITPATEILEYMAHRMPEVGGVVIQPEYEVAGINMIEGAAVGGTRCMTATSGPGFDLMQEGITFIANEELPCVIVQMSRGGPGSSGIGPSQADYFQCTKGGGHGDYQMIVLAPSTVQESVDLTRLAFHLADKYRMISLILGDGILAHTSEPVEFDDSPEDPLPPKDWAITGEPGETRFQSAGSDHVSIEDQTADLWGGHEAHNRHLQEVYRKVAENETRVETKYLEGADIVVTAFGSVARIAKSAVEKMRKEGLKVGFIRPITVCPFPYKTYADVAPKVKAFVDFEMNAGQMLQDVRLGVEGRAPVFFFGRAGGACPTVDDMTREIEKAAREVGL